MNVCIEDVIKSVFIHEKHMFLTNAQNSHWQNHFSCVIECICSRLPPRVWDELFVHCLEAELRDLGILVRMLRLLASS